MSADRKILENKVFQRTVAAVSVLAAAVIWLCWPVRTFRTPQSAQLIDLNKTENDSFYLSEQDYAAQMDETVLPYLEAYKTSGYFKGYDGNELYYEQYIPEGNKAHIVVSGGFTDASYKFREVIYYFLRRGYAVSIMDHRGHGYSYRSVEDWSKVTVRSFDEYVDDFGLFVNGIVKPALAEDEPLFLYAHSMGGAIAALYLEEEENAVFDAAVLTSPMMEIQFGSYPPNVVSLLEGGANLFGMGDSYIIGQGVYDETYRYEESSYNSEARYRYIHEAQTADPHYQTNGGTFRWLKSSIAATEKIRRNASAYHTETLLFQAGDDTTVGANGQNEFVSGAQNVQMVLVPDTKHNILFSGNDVFIPYMNTIFEFLQAQM